LKTAILVDGGFFLKRYRYLYKGGTGHDPRAVARNMHKVLLDHLKQKPKKYELYRILFYDCPPLRKRVQNPISKKGFDLGASTEATFRLEFHEELKQLRKVALRLGRMGDNAHWEIRPTVSKNLLSGKAKIEELLPRDVRYSARQKGVDMKIGLDIASLSYKKLVQQIILVSGDSDFVPAAKLARREGIDFVLDPMWNHINPDLHEHIDGLNSTWPKPF
jgi:uncharacterized LabA/DUF88 family protein